MVLDNKLKDKIVYSVERAVALIGEELFASMHEGLKYYDYRALQEIIDSTVEDLPKIIDKLGVSNDITNLVDLAASMKNDNEDDSESTQSNYRLIRKFVTIDKEKKKEIYHKKLVSLCKKYLRQTGEKKDKKKKVSKTTVSSSSTVSETKSLPSITDDTEKSVSSKSLDVTDQDASDQSFNNVQEVANESHVLQDSKASEELITLKISPSLVKDIEELVKMENQTLKGLTTNSKKIVSKMFTCLSSLVESVDTKKDLNEKLNLKLI